MLLISRKKIKKKKRKSKVKKEEEAFTFKITSFSKFTKIYIKNLELCTRKILCISPKKKKKKKTKIL